MALVSNNAKNMTFCYDEKNRLLTIKSNNLEIYYNHVFNPAYLIREGYESGKDYDLNELLNKNFFETYSDPSQDLVISISQIRSSLFDQYLINRYDENYLLKTGCVYSNEKIDNLIEKRKKEEIGEKEDSLSLLKKSGIYFIFQLLLLDENCLACLEGVGAVTAVAISNEIESKDYFLYHPEYIEKVKCSSEDDAEVSRMDIGIFKIIASINTYDYLTKTYRDSMANYSQQSEDCHKELNRELRRKNHYILEVKNRKTEDEKED